MQHTPLDRLQSSRRAAVAPSTPKAEHLSPTGTGQKLEALDVARPAPPWATGLSAANRTYNPLRVRVGDGLDLGPGPVLEPGHFHPGPRRQIASKATGVEDVVLVEVVK